MKAISKQLLLVLASSIGAFVASAQQTFNWTATSGTDLQWSTPANWTPSGTPGALDTVWFNNNAVTNGAGTNFIDNIITASTTIRVLEYSNNTLGFSHNTLLNPGVTLTVSDTTVNNNLQVGTGANTAGAVTDSLSGPGARLFVTNPGGNITLRSTSGGNTSQNTVFDMSALDFFDAGVSRLLVGSDAAFNREVGTLYLAKTNIISTFGSAPQINVGDNPSNGVGGNNDPTLEESFIYLGITNAIFSDSITIGRQKSSGAMVFNPAFTNGTIPSILIRSAIGSRVAAFGVSDQSPLGSSNQRSLGLVDFTGGTVNALINIANIGLGKNGNNTATAASENGTLTFERGTMDINTLNVGCAFVATSTGIGPIGTVNVNGTGALVVNSVVNLAKLGASPATPPQGTINVSGGTFTSEGPIVSGGGTSAINVSSGTLNAGFSGVVIGTLASPLTTLSLTNATLTLAPTFAATNIVVQTLNPAPGTTNTINIAIMPAITSYPAQVPLIQFTSQGGDLTTFVLGSVPAENPPFQGYITNDGASQVYLVLTNGIIGTPPPPIKADVWNGAPNGNWDTTTLNWTVSGAPTNYANITTSGTGDSVTFDDTATGTTNVVLTTTLSPASILVDDTSENYLFSGSGKLTGATGLTKQGAGVLTLAETGGDNYGGGIAINNGTLIIDNDSSSVVGGATVNAGTLQLGNNDANGVPPAGIITNNGVLVLARSDTGLTMPNIITGIGALVQNGAGNVTLSGVSTFTGPTAVNGGTLTVAGPNNNPSTLTSSSGLTINSGGTVMVAVDNAIAGSTGKLPITINAGGVLTGLASLNGGSGASSHIAGLLTLNGGTLTDGGTQLVPGNGTWDLDGGVVVPGNAVTSVIACLSVVPSQANGTLFYVTNGSTPSGIDLDVTGSFINGTGIHDSGITLDGGGTMAFENAGTYAGATTLTAGVLRLNNALAVQNSTVNLNEENGLQFRAGIGTFVFGGLNGPDSLSLTDMSNAPVTIQVGQNNASTTYSGILSGAGGLTKLGTGTLQLNGTNLYSGSTTISNGTLQLFDPADLTNTPSIALLTPTATIDVTPKGSGTLTIANNRALTGNGTISGMLTNLGLVSPGIGGTTGVLTVIGNVTLSGTTAMKIDKADGTNDMLVGFGSMTYGGTLVITNLNTPLAVNDRFQLFSASSGFSGSFSVIIPASPGSGLSWDTNSLATDGTLAIAVGPITGPTTNATITRVTLSGTNLLVHGTNNNVPNTSFRYVVLTSTNLATPLSNWTPVVTNFFSGDGTFDYQSPIVPGVPRQFITVKAVP